MLITSEVNHDFCIESVLRRLERFRGSGEIFQTVVQQAEKTLESHSRFVDEFLKVYEREYEKVKSRQTKSSKLVIFYRKKIKDFRLAKKELVFVFSEFNKLKRV